jgi:hypothetical protein
MVLLIKGEFSTQTARPLDSNVNKDKAVRMERESGGVGFVCAD